MLLYKIGIIHSPYLTRRDAPRQGNLSQEECIIEVYEEFAPALHRLEEYNHLVILYWLHQANRKTLQVHPRGHGALKGVFASRSPDRPNPVGLSVVRLIQKQDRLLTVVGLDAIDGTPLLDIKGQADLPGSPQFLL